MKLKNSLLPIMAVFAFAAGLPTQALAQHRGTTSQTASNGRAQGELRARINETDKRIRTAQTGGTIGRTQASKLRRQLEQTQQSLTRSTRRQGFVSAAESATYNRTLGSIDMQLDRAGAPRSYGNDALPSAEMIAFQRVDARLHYRNARIEWDGNNCAVYEGMGPDNRVSREPLRSPAGKPICLRR